MELNELLMASILDAWSYKRIQEQKLPSTRLALFNCLFKMFNKN